MLNTGGVTRSEGEGEGRSWRDGDREGGEPAIGRRLLGERARGRHNGDGRGGAAGVQTGDVGGSFYNGMGRSLGDAGDLIVEADSFRIFEAKHVASGRKEVKRSARTNFGGIFGWRKKVTLRIFLAVE